MTPRVRVDMDSVWIWLLVAALVVAAVVFFLRRGKPEVGSDGRRELPPESDRRGRGIAPAEGAPEPSAEPRDSVRHSESAAGGSGGARRALADDESSALGTGAPPASEPRRLRRADSDDQPRAGDPAPPPVTRAEPDNGTEPETGTQRETGTESETRTTGGASAASVANVPEAEARTIGGASVARVAAEPDLVRENLPPADRVDQRDVDSAPATGGVQRPAQGAPDDLAELPPQPQGSQRVPRSGEVPEAALVEVDQSAVIDVSGYGVENEDAALADAAERHGFGGERAAPAATPASDRRAEPGTDASAEPGTDASAEPGTEAAHDRPDVQGRVQPGEVVEPGTEVAPEETVRPDDLSEDVTERSYTVADPEDDHVPMQARQADKESTGEVVATELTRPEDADGRHVVDTVRAEDDLTGGYAPAGEALGQEGPVDAPGDADPGDDAAAQRPRPVAGDVPAVEHVAEDVQSADVGDEDEDEDEDDRMGDADGENVPLDSTPAVGYGTATGALAPEEDVEPVPVGWNGPFGPGSADANADGSGPEGWAVKGAKATKVYLTPEISVYDQAKANVWFIDEDRAKDAGFRRWDAPQS